MTRPAALLWDNDGILVDTEGLYFAATREALAGVGVELDEALYLQLFLREGRDAFHLARARAAGAARAGGGAGACPARAGPPRLVPRGRARVRQPRRRGQRARHVISRRCSAAGARGVRGRAAGARRRPRRRW